MEARLETGEIVDRPSPEDLSRCVHCGFCLQACPTYLQLGLETDSPRGRIHMARAMLEGQVEPTSTLAGHLDLCLQCRACETACPSGVPFGRIMESSRAVLLQEGRAPFSWRLRTYLLRQLLPYPKRLAGLFSALRVFQTAGPQSLLRRSGLLEILPRNLSEAEAMLPAVPARPFQMSSGVPTRGGRRVALLTGCVMPVLYPRTHKATVRVLNRHGIEVVAPPEQRCCGALNAHSGDRRTARELARDNIDAFLAADVEAVIVNSAGCGSTLKEYGELLKQDSAYAEKAQRFSAIVRDVSEFLTDLPLLPPKAALPCRVTYQDSCHLVHAQKVAGERGPRALLLAIPGLEVVEMGAPDRCCGSAGVYSFTQRDMSLRLLDEKMRAIAATGAPVIATANPGCMLQIEAGLRRHELEGRVVHVIELLDEAYRVEEGAEP